MEVEVFTHAEKGKKTESNYHKILSYTPLNSNPNLLLVESTSVLLDDNTTLDDAENLEIFTVKFIASCKIEKLPGEYVVAFYVAREYGELRTYVISTLDGNLSFGGGNYMLIDYNSYTERCKLTGEQVSPFREYYVRLKNSEVFNSFVSYKGATYIPTEQPAFFEKYEAIK